MTEDQAVTCTLTPSSYLYFSASWLSPPLVLSLPSSACSSHSPLWCRPAARLEQALAAFLRGPGRTGPPPGLRARVLGEPQQQAGGPSVEGKTTLPQGSAQSPCIQGNVVRRPMVAVSGHTGEMRFILHSFCSSKHQHMQSSDPFKKVLSSC